MINDERSVNSSLGKERYTYLSLYISHPILCLGVLVGLALIGVGVYLRDRGGLSGIPIGVIFTLLMFGAEKSYFERNRPLEIDEMSISAMALGRIWKSITWSDVKRIERIRKILYLSLGSRYGYEFVIVGAHEEIKLDDTIYKLPAYEKTPAILNTLNFYVQCYNIPLVAYDRGEDTAAKIKATVMDKQERKKLLREGVQTSIASL
jgi:hypothetical protein